MWIRGKSVTVQPTQACALAYRVQSNQGRSRGSGDTQTRYFAELIEIDASVAPVTGCVSVLNGKSSVRCDEISASPELRVLE